KRYVYTGILDLTDQSPSNILALLIASDELNLDELVQCSQEHLIKEESSWLRENFTSTLHIFNKHQRLLNLDRDILFEFIQSDFLTVKEIDIWNFLLKWTKSSHPFIPNIRFHEMSGLEFYDNFRPYKALLPDNLYESLENYFIIKRNHIFRPRCVSNSSKIIGGYNPLGLKVTYLTFLPQWDQTSDSLVKVSSQAILNNSGSWINFGNSDLVINCENGLNGLSGLCEQNSYEKILNPTSIEILEIFTGLGRIAVVPDTAAR
ncbi:33744_t:CDS:2, partial [Gigaspora margarita]